MPVRYSQPRPAGGAIEGVEISNNSAHRGGGIGLGNVRNRLVARYGSDFTMSARPHGPSRLCCQ